MRIVYSDESGLGQIDSEPITVITALMIDMDSVWIAAEKELRKIRDETPTVLLHEGRELKGKTLYGAVRKVKRLIAAGRDQHDPEVKTLDKSVGLLYRILAVPINYSMPIFYGAVDRAGYVPYQVSHTGPATAHDVAFDNCLGRLNNVANVFLKPEELILWIHDHRGRKEEEKDTKLSLIWTRYIVQMGWDPATLRRASGSIPVRLADLIYFGDSHDSLALQLADVCCSTVTLHLLETFYGWEPCAKPFYDIIQRTVMTDGIPPMHMPEEKRK